MTHIAELIPEPLTELSKVPAEKKFHCVDCGEVIPMQSAMLKRTVDMADGTKLLVVVNISKLIERNQMKEDVGMCRDCMDNLVQEAFCSGEDY